MSLGFSADSIRLIINNHSFNNHSFKKHLRNKIRNLFKLFKLVVGCVWSMTLDAKNVSYLLFIYYGFLDFKPFIFL